MKMFALILLVLALVACGGNGEDAQPDTVAPAQATTEDTATTTEAEATTETGETTTAAAEMEPVGDFILRVNEILDNGQYGRAWEILHPAQRKLFSSPTEFGNCLDDSATASDFGPGAEYEIVEVYDEPWQIPGTKVTERSKAVTVRLVMRYSEGSDEIETELESFTQHAFQVGEHWTWIVSQDVIEDLRDDFC